MKQNSGFMGTYFERDGVLRLERWTRVVAWVILVVYILEAGYNIYQNALGALVGGYALDFFYMFTLLSHALQGGMLFIILHVAAKVMLILMDIEDNTRRAARINSPKN
jgi:hypothetical protein